MVFQSYALFPHLDVAREHRVRPQGAQGAGPRPARRLARVADLLGLSALLDRKPSQLSGGQQQRVALGRAIIAETPVCLMDEPLSNLDAQLRDEMRREIRALQQQLGITMVYVTHDQTEAMSMADQVVLLRDGRIEQDAAPAELYARPATVFAARFIGTPPMNVIDCARRGADLTLGVRPEHIRIVERRQPARRAVQTRPSISAPTRSSPARIAAARRRDTGWPACRGSGRSRPATRIALAWDRDAEHHFDPATGLRRDAA